MSAQTPKPGMQKSMEKALDSKRETATAEQIPDDRRADEGCWPRERQWCRLSDSN
ncbi:MAG: hypothetical protein HLUCCO17_09900 [Saliniramus fredricksonii]|uniref:Uncharacterized protein n=1 Tax=Saliniramus fredricksonii TaxID=1653334 RepID=A0A0P7Y9J2_9HYPH|nr:MAG: hypothetical protein HLUCCO17_09900 [Saliniramus fredricksonii]